MVTLECYYLLVVLVLEFDSHRGEILILLRNMQKRKKDQLHRERLAAWAGTIRRESTREQNAEILSRQNEGPYGSGEGGEEPAM